MKVLVIKYISEEQWSVEQIVGYCRKNGIPIVGKTTIYKFIHQDKENGGDLYKHTRHQLKHRCRALYTCKKKVDDKKSIEERPEVVSQKTVLGSEVLVNTLMVLCGNTYQKILILRILQIKKLKNINIKLIIDQEKY